MSNSLPVISLSNLSAKNTAEIEKLYHVCRDSGFFCLKDHDVSLSAIRDAIKFSRSFFELPNDVKCKYGQEYQLVFPKTSRGYISSGGEVLNGAAGPDPKEIFDFGLDKPISDQPFTGPNLMPEDTVSQGFTEALYNLQHEVVSKVVPKLLRGFALTLNLEENWFDKYFDNLVLLQRVIYYPANAGRAGKHTDSGIFTILIQEVLPSPSLRVYTEEQWIDAPCHEDLFVINLGDMLQLWTDNLFVSTAHEVIHNLPASRISLPFFIYPNIDTIIEPFNTDKKISSKDVMLENFHSIWVAKRGAGMRVDDL